MKYTLVFTVTTRPDLSGFKFFIESGRHFDVDDYAGAYRLNRGDIDPQSWKAAQNAASQLNPGEWLEVTHELRS